MLASVGISMDDQDRTTIDMRREQTLNRNARASGGVTQFASSASSVQKWAMKRSDAAETKKKAICDMAGLSYSNTIYKSLRPKQILKSEKKVTKVTEAV